MSFLNELKRRNVLRVGAAYIVSAWLIVQVAETLFPIYGLTDAAVRMVVNILAVGMVPVLVLSWVFEWTPEGLKKDDQVEYDGSSTQSSAKRLDRIILVILALALGYFAFDRFIMVPQQIQEEVAEAREEGRTQALVESYGDQSIAVLPFTNMSSDSEQEYFADGLSEEILNLLASIPELRVISRSSSFTFKGKNVEIPEIAKQLKVEHVLEGSVRKSGNKIRITAQLIEARSDTHIWSQTWDRTLDDIFAIQDEIAAEVVKKMQISISGAAPVTVRTDPQMYALYLQAKQLMEQKSKESDKRARILVDQILSIDPDYVPALEQKTWLNLWSFNGGEISEDEFQKRRNNDREHILRLDPVNDLVHANLAWEAYQLDRDFERAAKLMEDLVIQNPNNAEMFHFAGTFLRRIGKYEISKLLLDRCVLLDPLKFTCLWQLKESHLWSGDLELARELTDQLTVIFGNEPRVHDILLLILQEEAAAAKALVETWPSNGPHSHALLAICAYDLDDIQGYENYLKLLLDNWGNSNPDLVAAVFAHVRDYDKAFEWLNRAFEIDNENTMKELLSPFYWNLHDDPRWTELRERLGMSEERLSAIKFTSTPPP